MKMKFKLVLCLFAVIFSVSVFAQTTQDQSSQEQTAAEKAWNQNIMQTYGVTAKDLSDYRESIKQTDENLIKAQEKSDQKVAEEAAQNKQKRDQTRQQAASGMQQKISQIRATTQKNLQSNFNYLKTLPEAKDNPQQAIGNVQKMMSHQYQLKQKQDKARASQLITQACDCYDASDPNNFASNFLYNEKHERVQRKNPSCRCLPSSQAVTTKASTGASKITATPVQPAVILKSSTEAQTPAQTSGWKIDYN